MLKMLKIGELAEASNSTIDTIRFYENNYPICQFNVLFSV